MGHVEVDAAVRARGGRMTVQRRLIMEALGRARHHTTAEQITRSVRSRLPHMNASTVYRNLQALERVGAVTHTHIEGRVTRWHLGGVERHGHLVCSRCGREDEVPLRALEPTVRRLRAEYGFAADLAHSAIVGICGRCATLSSA